MASLGYVLGGFLDNETPDDLTVVGDDNDKPFRTLEDAWAWVDENAGIVDGATVVVAEVVPVGLLMGAAASDEEILAVTKKAQDAFGQFYYDGGFDAATDVATINDSIFTKRTFSV